MSEEVQKIDIDELRGKLEKGNKFEFWNVLTDEFFKGEMIPGSRRVPLDQVGREVTHTILPKETEIIVYCAGPSCPASRNAAEKLQELGYTNVKAFEGGIEEWKNKGFDIANLKQANAA